MCWLSLHGVAQALGYEYLNLDDCYIAAGAAGRDANGTLVEDPNTFPSGMRALADYVHGLGMKFGVCTCGGAAPCRVTLSRV